MAILDEAAVTAIEQRLNAIQPRREWHWHDHQAVGPCIRDGLRFLLVIKARENIAAIGEFVTAAYNSDVSDLISTVRALRKHCDQLEREKQELYEKGLQNGATGEIPDLDAGNGVSDD